MGMKRALSQLNESSRLSKQSHEQSYQHHHGARAITSIAARDQSFKGGFKEIRRRIVEVEKSRLHASLMAVNGIEHNRNRLFIAFYENYAAYADAMRLARQLPFADVDSIQSFVVSLNDETNYRLLSMQAIAQHLLKNSQKKP
jgi:hypothetical protein